MEWVETTGATVEDARDRALDTLGVAFDDAEIEVVAEPKKGFLGIGRTDARVRARVRPMSPRPKVDRRDRGRKGGRNDRRGGSRSTKSDARSSRRGKAKGRSSQEPGGSKAASGGGKNDQNRRKKPVRARNGDKGSRREKQGSPPSGAASEQPDDDGSTRARSKRRGTDENAKRDQPTTNGEKQVVATGPDATKRETMDDERAPVMNAAEQAEVVEEFVQGLLSTFGADASIARVAVDEDTYEVQVTGDDLGLLIGPKGQTLQALQEVARTAVQQAAAGQLDGRVRIDVGGYRARRREALHDFALRLADDVRETGAVKVLEPMAPADRKVVHDAIGEVDGVESTSEGREPNRRVVLQPEE